MTINSKGKWNIVITFVKENKINEAVSYCESLEEKEFKTIENKLINELVDTKDNNLRNTIAIVLSDLKSNKSVDTIIKILNDKNSKNNAALIYALEELNCGERIIEIFHILLEGNYEAKCNLYTLLEKKIKDMKEIDKEKCLNALNKKIEKLETELEFLYDTAEKIFLVEYKE